jgi:hypothetical protein
MHIVYVFPWCSRNKRECQYCQESCDNRVEKGEIENVRFPVVQSMEIFEKSKD